MPIEIEYLHTFKRSFKNLYKKYKSLKADLEELESILCENPQTGDLIKNSEGLRKIRMRVKSKGKGKSGGARIIYYFLTHDEKVYLVFIYDKSEISDLPHQAINQLSEELQKVISVDNSDQ